MKIYLPASCQLVSISRPDRIFDTKSYLDIFINAALIVSTEWYDLILDHKVEVTFISIFPFLWNVYQILLMVLLMLQEQKQLC